MGAFLFGLITSVGLIVGFIVLVVLLIKNLKKRFGKNKTPETVVVEPEPLEEKKPEDMTEEELREHMFSSLGHVPVENLDGSIEYIGTYYKINDDEHCLITENGRTYHTRLGCFKYWKPEQQKYFNGWKYTTIENAESMGMKKCSFCDEADNRPEETIEDFLKWLDEEDSEDNDL